MNTDNKSNRSNRTMFRHQHGQSMVEFALILPLFVLFIIGVFELGRAFFSYIAITNAAREGARVVTFWPGKTTVPNVIIAVETEIETSPMVVISDIDSIRIECGSGYTWINDGDGDDDAQLEACPSYQPIRVTVIYRFHPILGFFLPDPLLMRRSAEMMVP